MPGAFGAAGAPATPAAPGAGGALGPPTAVALGSAAPQPEQTSSPGLYGVLQTRQLLPPSTDGGLKHMNLSCSRESARTQSECGPRACSHSPCVRVLVRYAGLKYAQVLVSPIASFLPRPQGFAHISPTSLQNIGSDLGMPGRRSPQARQFVSPDSREFSFPHAGHSVGCGFGGLHRPQ